MFDNLGFALIRYGKFVWKICALCMCVSVLWTSPQLSVCFLLNLDSFASKHVLYHVSQRPCDDSVWEKSPLCALITAKRPFSGVNGLLCPLMALSACDCGGNCIYWDVGASWQRGRGWRRGRGGVSVCLHALVIGRMTEEGSSSDYMLGLVVNSRSGEIERETGLRGYRATGGPRRERHVEILHHPSLKVCSFLWACVYAGGRMLLRRFLGRCLLLSFHLCYIMFDSDLWR